MKMKLFVVQRMLRDGDRLEFVENCGVALTMETAQKVVADDLCHWTIEEYEVDTSTPGTEGEYLRSWFQTNVGWRCE